LAGQSQILSDDETLRRLFESAVVAGETAWLASNAQASPVLRANLVMRGVPVEPGEHQIVLEYQAAGLREGFAVTVIALLILLVLAIAARAGRAGPVSADKAG
jgi:hypothetical protein